MKKLMYKTMAAFYANKDGLVTIEWVGIAAVVVVAGIVISGAIMQGTASAGANVVSDVNGSSGLVPTAADYQALVTPPAAGG